MSLKMIFLILLTLSTAEIFFGLFSKIFNSILTSLNSNIKLGEKPKVAIKLIVVTIFFISVIYFLIEIIIWLANVFGISLNRSIFDIF